MHDLRYALRMLVKSPRFTAAAALSLALAIGAKTVFRVAIALLLGAVAFLACYLPTRRAAKLDPVTALSRT